MLVFEKRRTPENPKKNLSEQRREPTKRLNPHMTPGPGIEPGTHWWEAIVLTSANPAPRKNQEERYVLLHGVIYLQYEHAHIMT